MTTIETSHGDAVEVTISPATPAALERVDYLLPALDVLATEIAGRFDDWRIDIALGPQLTVTAAPVSEEDS